MRRRLIITYLFVGLTPVVLLLALGALAATGGSSQAMVRVVTVQLEATERQTLEGAQALAGALARLPPNTTERAAQAWLDERAALLRATLPGARVSAWSGGRGGEARTSWATARRRSSTSANVDEETRGVGPDAADAREPLPAWLGGRAEWSGFAFLPPPEGAQSAFGTPSVRALVRARRGARGAAVLVTVPVSRALVDALPREHGRQRPPLLHRRESGRTRRRGRACDVPALTTRTGATRRAGRGRAPRRSLTSARPVRRVRCRNSTWFNFPCPVFLPATDWMTGERKARWAFVVDWSWSEGGKQFWNNARAGADSAGSCSTSSPSSSSSSRLLALLSAGVDDARRDGHGPQALPRDRVRQARRLLAPHPHALARPVGRAGRRLQRHVGEHRGAARRARRARASEARDRDRARGAGAALPAQHARALDRRDRGRVSRGAAAWRATTTTSSRSRPASSPSTLGDVSGKGLSASLVMSNLQATLRAQVAIIAERRARGRVAASGRRPATSTRAQALEMPLRRDGHATTGALVSRHDREHQRAALPLDRRRTASRRSSSRSTTTRTRTLRYTNAGHNAPLLVRADGTVERLWTGGTVLGAFDGVTFEEGQTDARTKATCSSSSPTASARRRTPRAKSTASSASPTSPPRAAHETVEQPPRGLFDEIDRWTGEAERGDDQTLVILKA